MRRFKIEIESVTGNRSTFYKGQEVDENQLVKESIDELLQLGFITDISPVVEKPTKKQ